FPVGCAWSPKVVLYQYFALNPDSKIPEYQTPLGVYSEHCGLSQVDLSWGHDEYLYHSSQGLLAGRGALQIRYHSFYAAHREGEYEHLMSNRDREMFHWVREFNPYDLYSKTPERP